MKKTGNIIAGIGAIALAGATMPEASAQEKPNIIFVLTDDLGYSDLSCYGNPVIQTPFLDQIAEQGVRCTNYSVTSPTSTPSRASLLTGRYASRLNLTYPIGPGSPLGLAAREITIAELLKENGYNTAAIGKWHLGDIPEAHPVEQGFDYYFGLLYSHDYRHPYVKTDTVLKIFRNKEPAVIQPGDSALTPLHTKEAVEFIKKQTKEKPFFLYLSYNMPHLPVVFAANANALRKKTESKGELGAVIEELDESLAFLWQQLEQDGLADNTIFIFSSDNGPWIEYPQRMADDKATRRWHVGASGIFRGSKAQTYEGGVRVPFIVYRKGMIRPGTTLGNPISNVDVFPTIAEWTGAKLPQDRVLDGQSIASLLSGETNPDTYKHRPIYLVNQSGVEAVKVEDWKYREVGDVKELFNLNHDPSERVNLINEEPEITARLKAALDNFPGNSF